MSDMDIYDETENLISSDEYSEEDDDLMNAAISSHNAPKLELIKSTAVASKDKAKDIKLIVRRKKLFNIYKKRSIKWLNNKSNRLKYKKYLSDATNSKRNITGTRTETKDSPVKTELSLENIVSEVICLEDPDAKNSAPISIASPRCHTSEQTKEKKVEDLVLITDRNEVQPNQKCEVPFEQNPSSSLTLTSTNKLQSPLSTMESNAKNPTEINETELETEKSNSVPLYKEINEMFPKYDAVVGKHIKSTNNTIDAVEENVTRILLEIQSINDILQAKEVEWNRLLHLKKIKEEILTRLVRKKHILELHKKHTDDPKCTLSELKELELYLLKTNSTNVGDALPSTTQKLVENRANMRREELERERPNTNRLQSILISSNILPKSGASNKHFVTKSDNSMSQELLKYQQYLDNKNKSNTSHSMSFADMKSMITDYQQRNPHLSHIEKQQQIKLNESSLKELNKNVSETDGVVNNISLETIYDPINSNSTPTLEKLLNTSSRGLEPEKIRRPSPHSQSVKFNADRQNNHYRIQSSGYEPYHEVSITPITNDNYYSQRDYVYKSELLRSALNAKLKQTTIQGESGEGGKSKYVSMENNTLFESDVPVCQECKLHESRFVCGGCGNQWYCSRRCQITAWDKHSEMCTE